MYATLSDIPRPDTLISAYEARLARICVGSNADFRETPPSRAREFDDILRTLELLMLDARSRRNMAVPAISRLPEEVITMILKLVAAEDEPRPQIDKSLVEKHENGDLTDRVADRQLWDKTFNEGGCLGWIRLTHVCRSWRSLLLSIGSLWSNALGRLPLADEELLQRIGEHSLLSVMATDTPFHLHRPQIFRKIAALDFVGRLRSLRLVGVGPTPWFIQHVEELHAMIWASLELLEVNYAAEPWTEDLVSHSILQTPSLRVARFEGYLISFESKSLRELSLNFFVSGSAGLPTDALFDILRKNAETLECLELVDPFALEFEQEAPSLTKLCLSRLQRVRLVQNFAETQCAFFKSIHLMPFVQFDIELYVEISGSRSREDFSDEVKPLLDAIAGYNPGIKWDGAAIFPPPDGYDNVLCFQLYDRPPTPTSMSPIAMAGSEPFNPDNAKLQLRVTNGAGYDPRDQTITFTGISHLLNPDHLVALSFGGFTMWEDTDIAEAITQFANLRMLHIIDPLDHGQSLFNNQSRISNNFPFLSFSGRHDRASRPLVSSALANDHFAPSSALDMLWLVQSAGKSRFSCSTWCNIIADQLRQTFCDAEAVYEAKPIKVLRISYLAEVLDGDEDVARAAFAEVAGVVEWMTG
ncbi:unnamed protein product [Peniophora sp. CBMAI 1063]|nr:unnamed protein product [Peniophora sp. CBMAI 1063]